MSLCVSTTKYDFIKYKNTPPPPKKRRNVNIFSLERKKCVLHEKKEKNDILNFFRILLGIFTELFELYVKKSDSLEIRC